MGACFADDDALPVDDKAWPSPSLGAVVGTYSEKVARRCRLQGCRYGDDILVKSRPFHVGVVERDGHEFNAETLVFTKELRIAEVVTNEQAARDVAHREGNELFTRAVVIEIAVPFVAPGAEHLVVAGHQLTRRIDDVERIVGFVFTVERVVTADDDPGT